MHGQIAYGDKNKLMSNFGQLSINGQTNLLKYIFVIAHKYNDLVFHCII